MLLKDVGHFSAQAVEVDVAGIGAVDEDPARRRPQQRGNQVRERRLAGPGGAHQGHQLADAQLEVHPRQRPVTVGVGKADVRHADAATHAGEKPSTRARLFGFVVGEEEHPPGRRHRLLQLDPDRPEVARRTGDAVVHAQKHREVADRHDAVDDPVGHENGHVDGRNAGHRRGNGRRDDDHRDRVALAQERLPAAFGEARLLLLARAEALHRGDAAHGLLHRIRRRGTGGALVLVGPTQRSGEGEGRDEGDRNGRPGDPDQLRRHLPVGILQDEEVEGGTEQHEERLRRHPVGEIRCHRRVVEHAIDAVPGALIVQNGHGQVRQPVEEPGAKAIGERLRQPHVDHELRQTPQAPGPAEAAADLVLGLRGSIATFEQARAGAARAAAEDDQQGEVDDHEDHGDAQRVSTVDRVEDGIHEGRIAHRRDAERFAQDCVVDEDLRHPRQEQRGKDGHEPETHLGREQPLGLGDQADAAPDHPEGLRRRHIGLRVDAVVEAIPAHHLLEERKSLAMVPIPRRRRIQRRGHVLGHAAARPVVSASTNAR